MPYSLFAYQHKPHFPCSAVLHLSSMQHTPGVTGTLDLTNSATHGKCNVVYVAAVITAAQKLQLQDCESFMRT